MKVILALTFASLFCMITSAVDGFETVKCVDYAYENYGGNHDLEPAFSLDFCRSTKLSGTLVKCCYIRYEDENGKRRFNCFPAESDDLVDIGDTIDKIEDENGYKVKSLDCNSRYLYAPLIIFAILILI